MLTSHLILNYVILNKRNMKDTRKLKIIITNRLCRRIRLSDSIKLPQGDSGDFVKSQCLCDLVFKRENKFTAQLRRRWRIGGSEWEMGWMADEGRQRGRDWKKFFRSTLANEASTMRA